MRRRRGRTRMIPVSRRRARTWTLAAGLAVALGMVLAHAWAGDPATARSRMGSAKDALEQKKYDTALNLLAKARAEDAELVEVLYWQGVVLEKKGDAQASLREYRAFREVATLAQSRSALTKE